MRCAVVQCPPVGRDGSTIETTADEFKETANGAATHRVRRLTNGHRRFDSDVGRSHDVGD
jgi:hypothetical protein